MVVNGSEGAGRRQKGDRAVCTHLSLLDDTRLLSEAIISDYKRLLIFFAYFFMDHHILLLDC